VPESHRTVDIAPARLRLSLPPDPARLLRARDRMREYLLSHCSDRAVVDDVVLCIEEACTNAIRHSGVGDAMEISLGFSDDELSCEVRDKGRGFDIGAFDPEHFPDPLATGGRGLFLIARLMDEFELRNDDGIVVRMSKKDVGRCQAPLLDAGISMPTETQALAREVRQRTLLEEIDEAFFALDWEYRYVHANEAGLAINHMTLDQMLGHTPWELFPKLEGTELVARYREAMELGRPAVLEHVSVLTGDWLEIRIYPTASGVSAFYREINDRKRVESELLTSRESLSTILATITDAFYSLDRDWRVTYINDKAVEVFGRPRHEIIGVNFWDLFPDAVGSDFETNKRMAMDGGTATSFEAYYETFNAWYEERDYPRDDGITVLFTDITDRKRAELELQRLYEESQAQGEELQAQGEELQAQAEELQAQRDELLRQTEELSSRQAALERANAGLAEAYRLSAALARLNQSLTSTFDVDEVLHRAVAEGVETLGAQACVLELRQRDCWLVKEVVGLSPDLVGLCLSGADASVASAMAETGSVLVITDAENDERVNAGTTMRYGTKAALIVPLSARGEILGSLQFIFTEGPRSFSDPEVDFATKKATVVALALENTRLYQDAVTRENLSAALTDIAASITSLVDHDEILTRAVRQTGEALVAESASICTVRSDALVPSHVWQLPADVVGVPIPRSSTPYVDIGIATGQPVAVDDCETDPRVDLELQHSWGVVSVMMAPLIVHGSAVGAMFFNYHSAAHSFTTAELDFVGRAAALISGALENARLHEEQARREQALDDILVQASKFHVDGAYDEIAQAACDSALTVFGCAETRLYRLEGDLACLIGKTPADGRPAVGERISLRALTEDGAPPRRPQFVPGDGRAAIAAGEAGDSPARPVLLVPVGMPGRFEKFLSLSWAQRRDELSADEPLVVQRFADQVELALSQAARREAQEESSALYSRLEASLLPRVPITHPEVRILSAYRTGEQRLKLGGDFFDVMACGQGRLAVGIGDVCGHGPDAAALGATLRATWRGLNLSGADMTTTMNSLESLLLLERLSPDVFVTFVGAWVDPRAGRLHFVSAGHPAPLLISGSDVETLPDNPGLPLGIHLEARRWTATDVELPPLWHLLFYTDGLVEGRAAPRSTERYGVERLSQQLRREAQSGFPDDCLERIVAEIEAAHGGPLPDDAAAVLISRI
jgi:PAS domain S-box-containing protein